MVRIATTLRQATEFRSGDRTCSAWHFAPGGARGARPVVVMAPGLAPSQGLRLTAYAQCFADAGYHVLLFDYARSLDTPGLAATVTPISMAGQLRDWGHAIAHARQLAGVDPGRVVLWGTSLSGGHVLATASRDPSVAAVIAQVPFLGISAAVRAVGSRQVLRVAATAMADLVGAIGGGMPRQVAAVGDGESRGLICGGDERASIQRLLEATGTASLDAEVPVRTVLQLPWYSPVRAVHRVQCPVLLQVASHDRGTPERLVDRVARRLPEATVRRYRGGHYDVYLPPVFGPVVRDQLAFLSTVAPVSPT